MLHRKLLRDPGPKLTRGPGRALLDALKSLRLNWELPHKIAADAAAVDDYPMDCTCMAPDLVRKFAERHFLEDRRQEAIAAIETRHRSLKEEGTFELDDVGPIDNSFIVDANGGSLPVASKRTLLAATWGTLPSGLWLSRHGWEVPAECPRCGQPDGLAHTLHGCQAAAPEAHKAAVE